MNPALYTTQTECPVCHKETSVTKVRMRIIMIKQDTDLCTYYRGINPYWYTIWVCEHCSYSAQDLYFAELRQQTSEKLHQVLTEHPIRISVGGERTLAQVVATFRLAIACAEAADFPPSRLGGLYLRLGWVYRMAGLESEEKTAHRKAIEYYRVAYTQEPFPIGKMSDITLGYIIGELLRRNEQYEEAIPYLNEVIRNPRAKVEGRILPMARDAYQQCRDLRKPLVETS